MAKGKSRQKAQDNKRARKAAEMNHPSGESRYGRKKAYLKANGGWGWQYSFPKPWAS